MGSKRRVDGVLLLNKPAAISSQGAVTRVKHLLGASKAGHTGTLDPAADGLLPICVGEATKFSQFLLDARKGYRATVLLGLVTASGDLDGEVLSRSSASFSREQVEAILGRFRGEIQQVPPMFSALKHAGKPLYEYARAGETVERTARRVLIERLEIQQFGEDHMVISVSCSKGTYIRTLAEDIGNALGCGACLGGLTRTEAGGFELKDAIRLADLALLAPADRMEHLLPVDALLTGMARLDLDAEQERRVSMGQRVQSAASGLGGGCPPLRPGGGICGYR